MSYMGTLGDAAGVPITDLQSLFKAIRARADHFDEHDCRSMDLGLDESELVLTAERA